MSLSGKVALITGSATGIGSAIARRFAREGAQVMVHGLNQEAGDGVVAAIREAGGEADFVLSDISEPQQCAALVESVIQKFGRFDILVNNAAVMPRGNIDTTDAKVFDEIMAVNTRAPFLLIQAALPHFRRQGGGAVLNIGSVNAYCGEQNLLAYSISKGGLMTLTRNLADALGPERIRVNQLNLGWVLTENEQAVKVKEGLPEDWAQRLPKTYVPGGRLLAPDEIAHFALAFVSDEGALVNGSVVELEQYPIIGRNPPKTTD